MIYYMKEKIKKQAQRRLQIIQGQIEGLKRMVQEEKYCIDILTQTSAVKESISSLENLLLENHIKEHLISQAKKGEERKIIKEILKVYKLSKKIK